MNRFLFGIVALMVLSVLAANFYIFYQKKSYDFLVEAPCDATTHDCFVRDCDSEDGCPPNNLATYRQFTIKAADFSSCTDNSCLAQCEAGNMACVETKCGDSPDDTCSSSTTTE